MKFKKVFQTLIDKFERERMDYALIGAFALNAYGYVRATQDVDFIVRSLDQNEIVAFLESLGFETIHRSTGFSNHVHSLPGLGRIDFVYVKGKTAEKIFQSTKSLSIFGDLRLPVAHVEHIVALKVFAMKNAPERTLREMADIHYLLHHTDLDPADVRPYFEKFDLTERYHELMEKEEGREP